MDFLEILTFLPFEDKHYSLVGFLALLFNLIFWGWKEFIGEMGGGGRSILGASVFCKEEGPRITIKISSKCQESNIVFNHSPDKTTNLSTEVTGSRGVSYSSPNVYLILFSSA